MLQKDIEFNQLLSTRYSNPEFNANNQKNIIRESQPNFLSLVNLFAFTDMKKPVLRFITESNIVYKISKAPITGQNPNHLYVKNDENGYVGKISDTGLFSVAQNILPENRQAIVNSLLELSVNPKQKLIEYGRKTGICSCCGRTLTDAKSVELGIGPICVEKWGI